MTYEVVFAPEAVDQLQALQDYLAGVIDPETAAGFVDAIVAHCEGFDTFPHRGMQRDDIRLGLRVGSFRRRTVIAFVVDDAAHRVTILEVFYGGQDYETLLRSD